MTPVSPSEVNCPNDDAREIGWSSLATHSAVHGSPSPDGADGGSGRATASSARHTASVDPPRPTAGWYRRDRPPALRWPGQSRPSGARDRPASQRGPDPGKLAESDEKSPWFPGKDRISVPDMAIATRR